jgi:hypothetical protein
MECAGYALVGETVPLTFIVAARDAVASAALSVKVSTRYSVLLHPFLRPIGCSCDDHIHTFQVCRINTKR